MHSNKIILLLINYVYNSIINPKKIFNVKKSIVDNIFVMASKSFANQSEEEEMEECVLLDNVELSLPIPHGIFVSIIKFFKLRTLHKSILG